MKPSIVLKEFKNIRKSTNKKEKNNNLLKLLRFPEITEFIKLVYNPNIKFGITKLPEYEDLGHCNMKEQPYLYNIIDILERAISISSSKEKKKLLYRIAGETKVNYDLISLALKKNLDIGMGIKGINKVYTELYGKCLIKEFKVMLAQKYDSKRVTYPVAVEPKLDGIRCIAFKDGSDVKLYTRKGQVITDNFPDIVKSLQRLITVDSCYFDGEILSDRKAGSNQVMKQAFRKYTSKKKCTFTYNIFECLERCEFEGKPSNIKYTTRKDFLNMNVYSLPNLKKIEYKKVYNKNELFSFYKTCLEQRYEGIIVKRLTGVYTLDRSYDWMKLKPTETYDLKVINILEGEGQNKNKMGALVCDYNGVEVRVGGGFSKKQRIAWWNCPEEILGKIIEIKGGVETEKGSILWSRFQQVREDK